MGMVEKSNQRLRFKGEFRIGLLERAKWRGYLMRAKRDGDLLSFEENRSLLSSIFYLDGAINTVVYDILMASNMHHLVKNQELANLANYSTCQSPLKESEDKA